MGKPAVTQRGDLTLVEIPLFFEAGELKGRVVFDPAGRVTGLRAVAPDAPGRPAPSITVDPGEATDHD
jgi:hypothetical protein